MTAQDRFGNPRSPGQQQPGGKDAMDRATEKADQVRHEAEHRAKEMTGQAQEQAKSQMESQKDRAAQSLSNLADALRQTSQQLEQKNQGFMAKITRQAASRVESISGELHQRDANQLIGQIEHFARRQPGIFLGGAFFLGMLGARFLKSSGELQQQLGMGGTSGGERQPTGGYTPPQAPGYGPPGAQPGPQAGLERAVGEGGANAADPGLPARLRGNIDRADP
ncbi:MAG: hypothetical protein KatS3mg057_1553 [Herpetosiphonaceae bacterium]|nr:MAG: hypothetical protein KatS3mg057_1553 [Herpetosiphonaceae bacterium]